MSKVTISYSSLKSASSEANQVAKKMTRYANNLNSAVYKKLSNYNGSYTSNISTAKSKSNSKISELKAKSKAYSKYADDLTALKDECLSTDKSVRSKVSQLTASFKEANGIKNSKVKNAINYCLTSFGNSTVAGRWVGNTSDKVTSVKDHITQSLKDWWNYDGGKQLVKGVVGGILKVAIAVCTIIAAVTSGAALIVIIAGAVAGGIAAFNGLMNIVNEVRGYNETHNNGEPALGRRRSNENTIQDTIRRESDSSIIHGVASGIDIINFACTVITFGNGVIKLGKNGCKWVTENNVFSKGFFTNLGSKIKSNFSDIKTAITFKDYSFFKGNATKFLSNLKNNLSLSYNNAGGATKTAIINSKANSLKNILTIPNNLLDGDSKKKVFTEKILFKGITVFSVESEKDIIFTPWFTDGQTSVLTTKEVTIDDFYNISKTFNKKKIGNSLFGHKSTINIDILSKLSNSCDISISVPEINMPKISLNVA